MGGKDEFDEPRSGPRIGPLPERLRLSPRAVRYLETQGVVRPERSPGPGGHRHYP
ncbi:MAG: MerR family transcriptional regulator, partial [Candidatus Limnocylindrales bacterium]